MKQIFMKEFRLGWVTEPINRKIQEFIYNAFSIEQQNTSCQCGMKYSGLT